MRQYSSAFYDSAAPIFTSPLFAWKAYVAACAAQK